MEQFFIHLAHAAIWIVLIIFILAFIGFIAIIRWLVGLFTAGGRAVRSGVEGVERRIER